MRTLKTEADSHHKAVTINTLLVRKQHFVGTICTGVTNLTYGQFVIALEVIPHKRRVEQAVEGVGKVEIERLEAQTDACTSRQGLYTTGLS